MSGSYSVKLASYRQVVAQGIKEIVVERGYRIAKLVRNHILKEMTKGHTGKRYRVPGTKRHYTASAPGEYPAIATGQLRASIQMAVEITHNGIYAVVGSNVVHGEILEAGLRPWLERAFLEKENQIKRMLIQPWNVTRYKA